MQPEISWVNMHIEALNARKSLHYPHWEAEDLLNTGPKAIVLRHWKHRVFVKAICSGHRPVIWPPKSVNEDSQKTIKNWHQKTVKNWESRLEREQVLQIVLPTITGRNAKCKVEVTKACDGDAIDLDLTIIRNLSNLLRKSKFKFEIIWNPHLIMLCSIRSQAISQNQDRVTRPHEHIAKRCLDFHLDGQEIVGTSNHLKQGCMLLLMMVMMMHLPSKTLLNLHHPFESLRAWWALGITLTFSLMQWKHTASFQYWKPKNVLRPFSTPFKM